MKHKNIFVAILAVLLMFTGTFFLNKSVSTSVSKNDVYNLPQTPARFKEIPFIRLTIKEVERQKKGSTTLKGAIPKQDIVFRDLKTWKEFWVRHSADEVSTVDFNQYRVAAVFLDEKPSSGYSVEIKSIVYDLERNHTQIRVEEQVPSDLVGHLTVVTYPADLVMFPVQTGTTEFVRGSHKTMD